MFRQQVFELLDGLNLQSEHPKNEVPRKSIPAVPVSAAEGPSVTDDWPVQLVNRFFASNPMWAREVGFFEIGEPHQSSA